MDRKIEVNLEKRKTRPSGTISNDGSGPAQLEGLVPMSHHNTEFRTLYKVGLTYYGQEKKKTYSGKGNIKEREKTPLTELDQESVVNGLYGVTEITLLITARKVEGKVEKANGLR